MREKFNVKAQLTHIALHVKDLQESIDFYKEWCGMDMVRDDKRGVKDERVVWMACPGQEEDLIIVLLSGANDQPKHEGMRHLGLAMEAQDDIKRVAEMAEEAGILHWKYQEHDYPVGTLCSIKDPDGHIVEFSYGQPLGPHIANDNDQEEEQPSRPATGGPGRGR